MTHSKYDCINICTATIEIGLCGYGHQRLELRVGMIIIAHIITDEDRQQQYQSVSAMKENPSEENLWNCVVAFQGYTFKTITGLPFSYTIKIGRNGNFTRELWIDRRESSKSLSWSSVLLAYRNIKAIGAVVERPKALGDIRGVSYIYGIFCRFELIRMPEKKEKKDERLSQFY